MVIYMQIVNKWAQQDLKWCWEHKNVRIIHIAVQNLVKLSDLNFKI